MTIRFSLRRLLLALPFLPAPAAARLPSEVDQVALLRAISAVETGHRPGAVGPMGERSAYQFTRDTWRMYSGRSFYDASSDPAHAEEVARKHLAYLANVLRIRKLAVTVRHLAAAWHYGPNFAHICRDTDYVRRVANLYGVEVRR